MPSEPQSVVLFESIHSLLQLKKELERRRVFVKAVPTPRHLSSDCGSSLLFPMTQLELVRQIVAQRNLDVQGIHELKE